MRRYKGDNRGSFRVAFRTTVRVTIRARIGGQNKGYYAVSDKYMWGGSCSGAMRAKAKRLRSVKL